MVGGPDKSSLVISILAHLALLVILTVNTLYSTPLPVFENTNQHDVISAVVLGDTVESKIIPQRVTPAPLPPPVIKKEIKVAEKTSPPPVKVAAKPKPAPVPVPQKVIALKAPVVKKIVKKAVDKEADRIAKAMLADMQRQPPQPKKVKVATQKEILAKFEKELQQQAELTMRQHLLEEDIRMKGEIARRAQGEVDRYKALILQAIGENWIIPSQSSRKLSSELMIRLSPGGMVLDVQVTRSSGDPALDSSARAAVLKASPLPVPSNAEAFSAFKRFVLKVKPENIL